MKVRPSKKMQIRKFYKPVAWLLGRQLLGSIKGILLYTAYGKKLDPRDWMEPHVFPSSEKQTALKFWREQIQRQSKRGETPTDAPANTASSTGCSGWRSWTRRWRSRASEEEEQFWRENEEFWFDYMADIGDGMRATYSMAYLSLSDLYLDLTNKNKVMTRKPTSGYKLLPRGQFLFIGGDTAYHTSDYISLSNRVKQPFDWAYEDVRKDTGTVKQPPLNRPLFGIPGNHDYYDQLDGFRRQFLRPIRNEPVQGPAPRDNSPNTAQLILSGFTRKQCSSYVALHLPFDWWLWGLDTEVGEIDPRQQKFFRDLCQPPPNKLILATCAPTTVFGKLADPNDGKAGYAIAQLGLSQPFLPNRTPDGTYDLDSTGDSKMGDGQCRLDISGDVHHYARYWGPEPVASEKPRKNARAKAPSAKSYASVVSGAGGAFHHPSETFVDEVREQVLYPSETESTNEVAKRIFWFWEIWRGGSVYIAGFALAFIITFADSLPESSRGMVSSLLSCFLPRTNLSPAIPHWSDGYDTLIIKKIGEKIVFFAVSFSLLFAAAFSKQIIGVKGKMSELTETRRGTQITIQPTENTAQANARLWIVTIVSASLWGLSWIGSDATYLTPFTGSALVLLSIAWAAGAITLSIRYSEFLFEKCSRDYIKPADWSLTWVLSVSSIFVIAIGLWQFGKHNSPASLVSDIVFILAVVGTFLGLLILPIKFGGELFQRKSPVTRGIGKLLIGLGHAILQIAVPFLLIRGGTYVTWLVAFLLIIGFATVGKILLRRRSGWLIILWFVYGGLMFTLPTTTNFFANIFAISLQPRWLEWLGRALVSWLEWLEPALVSWLEWLGPAIFAGLWGLVMSCVWLGWYLAVCFVFNGHNNEVGGAARIEEFKQFIRFCLTEKGLTGYVIAVDHPKTHETRDRLCPKIVDVIELQVRAGA